MPLTFQDASLPKTSFFKYFAGVSPEVPPLWVSLHIRFAACHLSITKLSLMKRVLAFEWALTLVRCCEMWETQSCFKILKKDEKMDFWLTSWWHLLPPLGYQEAALRHSPAPGLGKGSAQERPLALGRECKAPSEEASFMCQVLSRLNKVKSDFCRWIPSPEMKCLAAKWSHHLCGEQ